MRNKINIQTRQIMDITQADFKNATLLVSLLVNLFVLTTWLVAKASSVYAAQLIQLF